MVLFYILIMCLCFIFDYPYPWIFNFCFFDDNFLILKLKVVKYGTMGILFRIFLLYLQYEKY